MATVDDATKDVAPQLVDAEGMRKARGREWQASTHLGETVGRPEGPGDGEYEMDDQDGRADAQTQRRASDFGEEARGGGCLFHGRHRLSGSELGIEQNRTDVGDEVGCDIDARRDEDGRLDKGEIPQLQGIDEKIAE